MRIPWSSPPRATFRSLNRLLLTVAPVAALALAGCQPPPPPAPDAPSPNAVNAGPLRLLVVGDPALAQVSAREWAARAETPLEVLQMDTSQFRQLLAGEGQQLSADAMIHPSLFLGELAQRDLIVPVPMSLRGEKGIDEEQLLPLIRRRGISWGERPLAAPLGTAPFMLFYDRRVLPTSRPPPATWAELDALLAAWTTSQNGRDDSSLQAACGLALPLGEGWAARVLLARAAGYVNHPHQVSALLDWQSMEPLVNRPPFLVALEGLVAHSQMGPSAEMLEWTPADVWRAVRTGKSAIGIGWPARQSLPGDGGETIPVQVAELPGSDRMYLRGDERWDQRAADDQHVTFLPGSGRVGSVLRSSRRRGAAWKLLVTLAGDELVASVSAASPNTAPYRQTQWDQVAAWLPDDTSAGLAAQYTSVLQATFARRSVLSVPQLVDGAAYLDALDKAVRRAVRGEVAAAEALAETATTWRAITARVGQSAQAEAYLRSLGRAP